MGRCMQEMPGDYDLTEYREHLRRRNKSENTIRAYTYAVSQFQELYGEVNQTGLRLYKCHLIEHYKAQTVNVRIRALNSYREFMGIGGERLKMVKQSGSSYLEDIISQADYEYLKQCLVRDGNMLYYFVVRYMAATGMRVSEAVMVEVEDVKKGYRDVYSKENKSRRVYIPASLQKKTLSWLEEQGREKGYLFLNRHGEKVTPAAIRGQLRKFAAHYDIDARDMHPHAFRHRFAKNFIETVGDIAFLADLLGHEDVETTRIYLKRSSQEQYRIINQVMNW